MHTASITIATLETDPSASQKALHHAAYQLLYGQIAKQCHLGIDEISGFEIVRSQYGKPSFKDQTLPLSFNISHTKGFCASILAVGGAKPEVGIDVETVRPYRERVAQRIFSNEEYEYVNHSASKDEAFTKLWTLKEAYIKAIGKGLSFPLKDAAFIIADDGRISFSGCKYGCRPNPDSGCGSDCGCRFTHETIATSHGMVMISSAVVDREHLLHI